MRKECSVYGVDFKFRFLFDESDYLEKLCEELNKNEVQFENVERLYIQDLDNKSKGRK